MIGVHTRRGERDRGADGDIPHDQTDQSACWDAGAAQAGSATPSTAPSTGHKHMGTESVPPPPPRALRSPAASRLMTSEFPPSAFFLQDAPNEREGEPKRAGPDRAARVTSKSGTPALQPPPPQQKVQNAASAHLLRRYPKNGGTC